MSQADDVLDNIDHALHDWATSADAMRWTPQQQPAPAFTPDQLEAFRRAFGAVGEVINRQMRVVAKAAQQVVKGYVKVAHRLMDHNRVRCRVCRPYSNPKPLAFGSEYHRRQKRRNRR